MDTTYTYLLLLLTQVCGGDLAYAPDLFQEAVDRQLIDSKEIRYIGRYIKDIDGDINLLMDRLLELHDAPLVEDSERFTPRETINDYLSLNRQYRNCLENHVVRNELIIEAIRECDILYWIWDTVRDCKCEYYYITVRRRALKTLREKIGEENYYSGRLPYHVPIWRFNPIP